jgi:hypothetical protein
MDREEAKAAIEATFASMPEGAGRVKSLREARDPGRNREIVDFRPRSTEHIDFTYKFYSYTDEDYTKILFLRAFLTEYLNNQLRHENTTTYHVSSKIGKQGGHAYLEISGDFAKEWVAEYKGGMKNFNELYAKDHGSQLEDVGRKLRKMMKWVDAKEV